MRRLADGRYALITSSNDATFVRELASSAKVAVRSELSGALARLAHGVPEDDVDDELEALIAELSLDDVVVRDAPWVDPVVEARLAELGEGYTWLVDEDPRAKDLVALLRRAHARRKVFLPEYGQTPVLPEVAAFRCLELDRALGGGAHKDGLLESSARVIHIGDDDMLSLGMAALGHRAFVADIDPLLIDFLARVAKEEGLELEARVTDLLAPFPEELCGAFDAAFSDPMSYERCQLVFLSRACSALKSGGLLWTTVHPLAREVCERVYHQLPVVRRRAFSQRNAYYWLQYEVAPYRSDLVLLERVPGEPPWAPADQIPFEEIVVGELAERIHAALDARGVRSKAKGAVTSEELIAVLKDSLDVPALGAEGFVSEDARFAHAFLWFEGGQLSASFDQARGFARLSVYPFDPSWEGALHGGLARLSRPITRSALTMPAFQMPPLRLSRAREAD